MKKLLAILLTLAMVLSLAACAANAPAEEPAATETPAEAPAEQPAEEPAEQPAEGETKTIAFLPPAMISPYYASAIAGAEPRAKELGYEFVVAAPESESDYAQQVQLVEDMITRGVDGIILCAINTDAIVTAVQKANEAGIPVVMFNTQNELASGEVASYVRYDQREGGAKVADYVAEVMNGKANVAIIEGLPSEHTTARMGGFIDRCKEKYPDVKVVVSQAGDWEREKGMNAAANMLQANPDIDAFFALCDEMALGAVQAVKQAGGDQLVFGFDGNPNAAQAVLDGDLVSTLSIGGFNTGVMTVDALDKIFNGQTVDKVLPVDTFIVNSENAEEYLGNF
jgi:ribose transport system substrate-binding protein